MYFLSLKKILIIFKKFEKNKILKTNLFKLYHEYSTGLLRLRYPMCVCIYIYIRLYLRKNSKSNLSSPILFMSIILTSSKLNLRSCIILRLVNWNDAQCQDEKSIFWWLSRNQQVTERWLPTFRIRSNYRIALATPAPLITRFDYSVIL